jgi:hypothetical protein
MVGNGQVGPETADNGADQSFRLTQGKPKHRPQRQGCQDSQRRIPRLLATGRSRRRLPARDRSSVNQTGRQASALAQARVIRPSAGQVALLLRDMMTTCSNTLERHAAIQITTGIASYPNRTHLPRDNQGENRIASSGNAPLWAGHCLTRMLPSRRHFVNREGCLVSPRDDGHVSLNSCDRYIKQTDPISEAHEIPAYL